MLALVRVLRFYLVPSQQITESAPPSRIGAFVSAIEWLQPPRDDLLTLNSLLCEPFSPSPELLHCSVSDSCCAPTRCLRSSACQSSARQTIYGAIVLTLLTLVTSRPMRGC